MATKRQTFRLYPNKEQERVLFEARRNHAYLYNACVAHRRYEGRANKKTVTYFEQQNSLPAFKKAQAYWLDEATWANEASKTQPEARRGIRNPVRLHGGVVHYSLASGSAIWTEI